MISGQHAAWGLAALLVITVILLLEYCDGEKGYGHHELYIWNGTEWVNASQTIPGKTVHDAYEKARNRIPNKKPILVKKNE